MTLTPPPRRSRAKSAPLPPPPSEMGGPLTLRRDVYHCYDPANKVPPVNYLCIVCVRPLIAPLITCEVAKKGTDLLYSYQAHQKCWVGISDREKRVFDQALRDLLAKGAT